MAIGGAPSPLLPREPAACNTTNQRTSGRADDDGGADDQAPSGASRRRRPREAAVDGSAALRVPTASRARTRRRAPSGTARPDVLLQAVPDDAVERRRHVGAGAPAELGRILPQDRRHRLGRRVAPERAPAGEHLVEHGAEREQVRARVDRLAAHLLRRHVADRAEHDAGVGDRRRTVSVAPSLARGQPSAAPGRSRESSRARPRAGRCSPASDRDGRCRLSCAAARPRAICTADSMALRSGIGPCCSRSRSVSPSSSSVTA